MRRSEGGAPGFLLPGLVPCFKFLSPVACLLFPVACCSLFPACCPCSLSEDRGLQIDAWGFLVEQDEDAVEADGGRGGFVTLPG